MSCQSTKPSVFVRSCGRSSPFSVSAFPREDRQASAPLNSCEGDGRISRGADTAKGNRPSFTDAAAPEEAEALYERFCADLRALGVPVAQGLFGAKMAVELVNDGPVTILL